MQQTRAEIIFNTALSANYGRIGLRCGGEFRGAQPGQFVMVGFHDGRDPLLRRPFSIHGLIEPDGGLRGIELLYKVVGPATRRMAQLKAGDGVSLLGPLGNGYRVPGQAGRLYLAAGGIGVAPLLFLARKLKQTRPRLAGCRLFLGGRSREDLLCAEEFERLDIPVHLTTDDGSFGDHCLVTHPLEVAIAASPPDLVLACGPAGMLQCVVGIVRRHRIACQVSIETIMACGMGACLGCAVESRREKQRYRHACLDGPVFDADEIEL